MEGGGIQFVLDNCGTLAFFFLKSVCVLLNINCVSKDYQRILIFPYCPGPLKISWFHQSGALFNNWIVLNDIKSLWIESVWKEMKWWLCCLGTKARVIIGPTITGNNIRYYRVYCQNSQYRTLQISHTRLGLKMADQTELFMEFNSGQFTYWSPVCW